MVILRSSHYLFFFLLNINLLLHKSYITSRTGVIFYITLSGYEYYLSKPKFFSFLYSSLNRLLNVHSLSHLHSPLILLWSRLYSLLSVWTFTHYLPSYFIGINFSSNLRFCSTVTVTPLLLLQTIRTFTRPEINTYYSVINWSTIFYPVPSLFRSGFCIYVRTLRWCTVTYANQSIHFCNLY